MTLEEALRIHAPDVWERYSEAVGRGQTSAEELEHTLEWVVSTIERQNQALGERLAVSTHLGAALVNSRIVWKLTGMHPCMAAWLEPDEFMFGEAGAETHSYVPPLGTSRAQGEAYEALRRDGTSPQDAAEIARLL